MGGCPPMETFCFRRDMKDSVSEAIKVSVTEGISFLDFNLFVNTLSEAVSIRTFKGIKYRS